MKPKKIIKRKEVEYFGMSFLVQSNMKYIAVYGNGDMFAFTHKPIPVDRSRTWAEDSEKYRDTDLEFLGTVELEKGENWTETLRKVQ